jgi:tRNA threonylcarbamoyl adenosine modification protein (Sua5/YciO/YrdC/YwlC family)
MAFLVQIHPDNPDPKRIQQVVETLKKGGVIIYPTDSVYSIGCDLMNPKALERVARIKDIKLEKANFSIICFDLSHISEYAKHIENPVFKLMKKALPGPYTFILNASSNVPKIFQSKKKTIGIRVPDNNIAREIVRTLGNPIVSTSVHDDDEIIEYTTDPELIFERYEKLVDLVINGGFGQLHASTVVDCTSGEPEVIREGIGEIDSLI